MKRDCLSFLKFTFIGFCCLVFLSCWALSSPPGSNSDDEYHLAGIWCAHGERTQICSIDEATGQKSVPRQIQRYSGPQGFFCYVGNEKASSRCVRELSPDVVMELYPTGRISEGQYPAGFYKANGFLVSGDINWSILKMRFFQIGIAIFVFSMALYTARKNLRQILSALLIGFVPIGLWVIPSTQPASWAIIGLVSLVIYLIGVTQSRTKANFFVIVVGSSLSFFLAIQSRRDSILNLLIVLVLVGISQYKTIFGQPIQRFMRAFVLSLFFSVIALVHFRFRSLSFIFQISGLKETNFFEGVFNIAPSVVLGLIGGSMQLGSPDFAPPLIVPLLMIIGLGTFLASIWSATPRETQVSVVVGSVLLFALPLRFFLENAGSPVSRYIYVIYLSTLILIAVSTRVGITESLKYRATSNRVILFSVALAHAFALHQTLRRYVFGTNVSRFDLNFSAEWWWTSGPSPMSVWLIGSISFTIAMSLTLQISKVRR
jgi:hypothetical protein